MSLTGYTPQISIHAEGCALCYLSKAHGGQKGAEISMKKGGTQAGEGRGMRLQSCQAAQAVCFVIKEDFLEEEALSWGWEWVPGILG